MKLKDGFITQQSGDQQILVFAGDCDFSGLVRSNKTAAFIVDMLKTETTADEIVNTMLSMYDAPEEVIRADVEKIIDKLRKINTIAE